MLEINTEHTNVMEVISHGELTKEDIEKYEASLKERVMKQEPINLLLNFNDLKRVTPKALLEDANIAPYLKNINKIAVISEEEMLEADVKVMDLIPGVQVSYYSAKEETAAKKWLSA